MSLFSNWTVGRRLLAGFGLSAAVLMMVAVVSYRNAYLLIENDAWVAHSHQVRIELADLLSELKDAETGQRGYLLTGDDSYLEPYKTALGSIQTTLANLRKLTADNPPPAMAAGGPVATDRQQIGRTQANDRSAPDTRIRRRSENRADKCW